MHDEPKAEYVRREFLKLFSTAAIGVGVGVLIPGAFNAKDGVIAVPTAEGYLLVDTKKCAGCMTCMLTCSLAHHGKENLSLSRIQVIQSPFGKFPSDITVEPCRQCERPACVQACETGAIHVDKSNGKTRVLDERKCIGCMRCILACPHVPARVQWNSEAKKAQKCDLCLNAPFWEEKGGPDGKQACVEMCPVKAIAFTKKLPVQEGETGYRVNLRNENWAKLGFPLEE